MSMLLQKRLSFPPHLFQDRQSYRCLLSCSSQLTQKKITLTTVDKKTKLTLQPHHLPDPIYHKAAWRPVPAQ